MGGAGTGTSFAVVLPFSNSERTLPRCLQALRASTRVPDEVIAVSDGSSDRSAQIAREFGCKVIELAENRGPAHARNVGARAATSDILVFLDADVIIEPDTLSKILKWFQKPELTVLQCVYSHQPDYNLVTQYQQSYAYYFNWHLLEDETTVLATSCCAIRRWVFEGSGGFNTKIKNATAEDEELGYELIDRGHTIALDKDITVRHDVHYSLRTLVSRNTRMYRDTFKSYLRKRTVNTRLKQENFSSVLAAIPVAPAALLSFPCLVLYPGRKTLVFFCATNGAMVLLFLPFWTFVGRTKGLRTALGCVPLTYLDSFLKAAGTLIGLGDYLLGRRY